MLLLKDGWVDQMNFENLANIFATPSTVVNMSICIWKYLCMWKVVLFDLRGFTPRLLL